MDPYGSKYLLRKCWGYDFEGEEPFKEVCGSVSREVYIYKYISKYGNCAKVDRIWMNIDVLRTIFI
jgi:hypothetical protein